MTAAKRIKKAATRFERKAAKDIGGRRTFASGIGSEKGDGRKFGKFRLECKTTTQLGYRFTIKEWVKLKHAAMQAGEKPVFLVELADKSGMKFRMAVLDYGDFMELQEQADENGYNT